jgi:hypothetical protein
MRASAARAQPGQLAQGELEIELLIALLGFCRPAHASLGVLQSAGVLGVEGLRPSRGFAVPQTTSRYALRAI